MKALSLVIAFFLHTFLPQEAVAEVTTAKGAPDWVICTQESSLNLRDESLTKVIMTAKRFQSVKLRQGFTSVKKTAKIRGKDYVFIPVQVPGFEKKSHEGIGWMAEGWVKPRSSCPGASASAKEEIDRNNEKADHAGHGKSGGIYSSDCCVFPINHEPTREMDEGGRKFGARRLKGQRRHAANDLIGSGDTKVYAIDDGIIVRNPYRFYDVTYALEVKHTGGVIVRYGEIKGTLAGGLKKDMKVTRGQLLGTLQTNTHKSAMLHFELYAGTEKASKALTQKGHGEFWRRDDLMRPTDYLQKWKRR